MKTLVLTAILLTLASAQDVDIDAIGAMFDGLLADEDIELAGDEYDDRLGIFTLNYVSGGALGIDLMYTSEELSQMNGAKMLPSLRSALAEELEKRGESLFEEDEEDLEKRSYLNNAKFLHPAVHQGVCGNCYLHTFVAALEMAYAKATGQRIKFSEQEMTDCYEDGCGGGDYKMVSITMSYLDKLSTKEGYGKYHSKQVTCRMGSTPDALTRLKVVDFLPVTANTFEQAIRQYGSVMTCMAWGGAGEACDMSGYTGGIVNYPEVAGGCDHAVLIVGYTPTAYLVRNSHGHNWGINGHFWIRRGTNSCGIEQDMAVVVTAVRSNKAVGSNGCPPDKPYLCGAIHTCSSIQQCATSISRVELEEREDNVAMEEDSEDIEERELSDEDDEFIEFEKREVRIPGEREKRDEEEEERKKKRANLKNVPGKLRRMLAKRGVTDEDLEAYYAKRAEVVMEEVEDLEKRCSDANPSCPRLKASGVLTKDNCEKNFKRFCAASCNMCGAPPKPKVEDTGEQMGSCLRPDIPNGRATNNNIMQAGEPLNIQCNPGYVLAGSPSKCLIQNIFTNDIKDGRLIPECVKVTKGAALIGNGAGYLGDKNTYSVGPVSFECDSWNRDVLRGILVNNKDAMELALGNHNFCRNPGGVEPVPFCLGNNGGSDVGSVRYCFGHAGCDTCAGASDRYGADYCGNPRNTRYCLYTDKRSANRVEAIQSNCAATCCKMAGC
ncbi:hypothetical protein ACHWQZ_G000882 [Mnemiopsis leidyi]